MLCFLHSILPFAKHISKMQAPRVLLIFYFVKYNQTDVNRIKI